MEGSISGVSFYSIAGSDKVIMRTKGGPSKRRMKEGKEFEMVRRHQTEWAACVLFSRGLKYAMGDNYRLADYNVSPVWNGIGKKLINLDEESTLGERHLRLSVYREAIAGFSLNKNFSFNAVMRAIPTFEVDKEKRSAIVRFPQINTENDLLKFTWIADPQISPDGKKVAFSVQRVDLENTIEWRRPRFLRVQQLAG